MDSKELAELVDFGASHSLSLPGITLDSLLVVRHGKIVVEAYFDGDRLQGWPAG